LTKPGQVLLLIIVSVSVSSQITQIEYISEEYVISFDKLYGLNQRWVGGEFILKVFE